MEKKTLVGLMVAVLAVTAGARTVYDGGKALRQNATSSSITGANGETYTDENGGKWQYLRANDNLATSTVAFGKSVTAGTYRGIGGNSSGAGAPYLHVNTSGSERPVTGGEPIEPDELYVHPGDPNSANSYVVLRFTVPEAGWYSALLSAHDANKHQSNPDPNTSGAEIRLVANGKLQARSVVSLEDCTNSNVRALLTHRFDFQMPVRWMAANETLDFMVGANGGHTSDATGLKVFVTKEDEGMFYDSGIAMTNNLATVYTNVYGTAKDGTWYYLLPWVSVSTGAAFEAWAPLNFSKRISLFTNRCTRTFSSNQRGFSTNPEGKAPYMIVNETDTMASYVAPQELHTHPANIQQADSSWRGHWATLRFRAPVSGYYSASVVARDVSSSLEDPNSNGVRVHLNVSDHVVASAHIAGEYFSSTTHLTFEPRLLVAGEPVDVIVAQASNFSSDATAFSVIIHSSVPRCAERRRNMGLGCQDERLVPHAVLVAAGVQDAAGHVAGLVGARLRHGAGERQPAAHRPGDKRHRVGRFLLRVQRRAGHVPLRALRASEQQLSAKLQPHAAGRRPGGRHLPCARLRTRPQPVRPQRRRRRHPPGDIRRRAARPRSGRRVA